MNLRNIANSVITGINPNIKAKLLANDGYEIDEYGNQIPKITEIEIIIQAQDLKTQDLEHLNLVGQQGAFMYAYSDHFLSALRRDLNLGQDQLIFLAPGDFQESTWIIKQKLESYSTRGSTEQHPKGWNKVLVWRQ